MGRRGRHRDRDRDRLGALVVGAGAGEFPAVGGVEGLVGVWVGQAWVMAVSVAWWAFTGIALCRGGRRTDHVVAALGQPLAAGQAPWPPHCLVAGAADPEPGWVLAAVDAQLNGAWPQPRRDRHGPPGLCRRGSGPVLARRHARGSRDVLGELPGEAMAAWPTADGRDTAHEDPFPKAGGRPGGSRRVWPTWPARQAAPVDRRGA